MLKKIIKIVQILSVFCLYSIVKVYAIGNDDIRSIKGPRITTSDFVTYQLIIIFLLIGLYVYYNFFVNKKTLITSKKDDLLEAKKKIINELKKLKKNSENYNKSIFYSELNMFFREYFKLLNINNADKLSLSDMKKLNLDNDLVNLYEKSYLSEFNDKNDIKKSRLEIIDNLIKLIK